MTAAICPVLAALFVAEVIGWVHVWAEVARDQMFGIVGNRTRAPNQVTLHLIAGFSGRTDGLRRRHTKSQTVLTLRTDALGL